MSHINKPRPLGVNIEAIEEMCKDGATGSPIILGEKQGHEIACRFERKPKSQS